MFCFCICPHLRGGMIDDRRPPSLLNNSTSQHFTYKYFDGWLCVCGQIRYYSKNNISNFSGFMNRILISLFEIWLWEKGLLIIKPHDIALSEFLVFPSWPCVSIILGLPAHMGQSDWCIWRHLIGRPALESDWIRYFIIEVTWGWWPCDTWDLRPCIGAWEQ